MAQAGFTRKKVESLTLGERLRKIRTEARMNLSDISKATKIQVKYLEYLESGEYEKLPADVYVRGFLRSYARYLNVDEHSFIRVYERERNIQANLGRTKPAALQPKALSMFSFVITPRTVLIALIVLVVTGVFAYLYREFQSFASVPRLIILEPLDGSVVEQSEVTLRGETDKGARVSINGEPVFVGSEGEFQEKLTLQQGLNTVTVLSLNRFEKEKSATVSIEARYAASDPGQSADLAARVSEGEAFFIEVSSLDGVTPLSIEADGEVIFNGILPLEEARRIEAREGITVSADKGDQVIVRFKGGEPQPLLDSPGKAEKVLFTEVGKNAPSGV